MTQQGLRQASARNLSGFATGTNYNEDFLRLFDAQGVAAGTFNERQLRWINARMGATFTNLDEAMQAYATGQGVYNWSSLGALEDTANFTRVMPYGATYTRTGVATGLTTAGLITSFAADGAQQTDRGLALEPASTNIMPRFAPTVAQLSLGLNASDTTAPASPPISDLNWIALNNTSSIAVAYQTLTVTGSTAYSISVLVETPDGTQPVASSTSATGDFNFVAGGTTDAAPTFSYLRLSGNVWRVTAAIVTPVTPTTNDGIIRHSTQNTRALKFAGFQLVLGAVAGSPIVTTGSALARSLPVFTEVVPAGRTKALLTYADATTTLVTGLTPGGTFDVATTVIAANKGRFASSELVTRVWQA
jgi:hypothetical protein